MIKVSGLTKSFGHRTAVQQATFAVESGKIVGFLGPNGAGKTTSLRMIAGFIEPTDGAIRVNGIDVIQNPIEAQKHIGYMPEGVPLHPELRVSEYLRFRAAIKRIGSRQVATAVDRALHQASVDDVADRIIGQLSKGYRQRIGLADALLADPPLLVLDEPTSGLDPNQMRQVRELIRSFAGTKTVFLSTHILPEVEASCDEVIVIHHGQIVRQGPIADLSAKSLPASTVRMVFRCESNAAEVKTKLLATPGVDAVCEEALDALLMSFVLTVAPDYQVENVSESLFSLAAHSGWFLRELCPVQRNVASSLEDVFASLTDESRAPADTANNSTSELKLKQDKS